MKNCNPFLGVPLVSSNTLIKPNTEKRRTEKDGRCGVGRDEVIFFSENINNAGTDVMKI